MKQETPAGEELIAKNKNAAGIILAVTEHHAESQLFFKGDLMNRGSIDLAFGSFLTCTPNNPAQDHGNEQLRTMIFSPMCSIRRVAAWVLINSELQRPL